jgi:hypothetical protein
MSWITWYVVAEDLQLADGSRVRGGRRLCEPMDSEAEARGRWRELLLEHPCAAMYAYSKQVPSH